VAGLFFRLWPELQHLPSPLDAAFQLPSPLELASLPTATRFDFPMGSEHGALAYNAQPFPENRHLGDDLNGIGGQNSDLGDPVYSIADGRVLLARDGGPGWGNVVIVLHAYEENGTRKYVQSFYGHLDKMLVEPEQDVRRGEQIGTVGNAGGRYWAHLHLEMREFVTPFVGPGYREDTRGWIDPSEFIQQHRGAPEDDVGRGAAAE
jgi:murein DD-endopeptidase MepM/ murein hydrolase activator NlpD